MNIKLTLKEFDSAKSIRNYKIKQNKENNRILKKVYDIIIIDTPISDDIAGATIL
ncbi:MAG: hypothetical protein ABF289_18520 [Clostridiales bacterium]